MKQKIFAICDLEEAYALRLAEYMLEKIRVSYALHLFTRVEELERFMEQEEIAILLIAESALELLHMEYVKRQVVQMFVLQENDIRETDMQESETQNNEVQISENRRVMIIWYIKEKFKVHRDFYNKSIEAMKIIYTTLLVNTSNIFYILG